MRLTIKTVNDELHRLGHDAELVKSSGYFYFTGGDTNDWLDRTVRVQTISSLALEQWVAEFDSLKRVNGELLGGVRPGATQKQVKRKAAKKK